MVWALLPLLVLALIFGVTAIERDLATKPPPAAPSQTGSVSAVVAAQTFMVWRNAVMGYAQEQVLAGQSYATLHGIYKGPWSQYTTGMGYFGGIQPSWLVGYGLSVDQANGLTGMQAGATICDPGSDGHCGPNDTSYNSTSAVNQDYVCVWMNAPAGTVGQIISQYGEDFTVGSVTPDGQSWVQTSGIVTGAGGSVVSIPGRPSAVTALSSIPCVTATSTPAAGDIMSYAIIRGN